MWSGKSIQSQKEEKKKNYNCGVFFSSVFLQLLLLRNIIEIIAALSQSNKAVLLWYILSLLYIFLPLKKWAKV